MKRVQNATAKLFTEVGCTAQPTVFSINTGFQFQYKEGWDQDLSRITYEIDWKAFLLVTLLTEVQCGAICKKAFRKNDTFWESTWLQRFKLGPPFPASLHSKIHVHF